MQAAGGEAMLDRAPAHAERQELRAADRAALAARELCHARVGMVNAHVDRVPGQHFGVVHVGRGNRLTGASRSGEAGVRQVSAWGIGSR